jgi:hypothetical protein
LLREGCGTGALILRFAVLVGLSLPHPSSSSSSWACLSFWWRHHATKTPVTSYALPRAWNSSAFFFVYFSLPAKEIHGATAISECLVLQ